MQALLFGGEEPEPTPPRGRRKLGLRLRFAIFKRDGFKCVYCGKAGTAAQLEVDHVLAVALGGTNHYSNLVAACWECNRGKSDLPMEKAAELARAAPVEEPVIYDVSLNPAAVALGRRGGKIGGKSTTPAKAAAARKNGKKGGRPPKKRETR